MANPTSDPEITASDDMLRYFRAMCQVKLHMDQAIWQLAGGKVVPSGVRYAALHMRLAIETLLLSSLASNRQAVETVASALEGKTYAHVGKLLRRFNEDYWPVPMEQEWMDDHWLVTLRPDLPNHLGEGECLKVWGKLSEVLHAPNPLKDTNVFDSLPLIAMAIDKMSRLLNMHVVHLIGTDTWMTCNFHTTGEHAIELKIPRTPTPDPSQGIVIYKDDPLYQAKPIYSNDQDGRPAAPPDVDRAFAV